MDVSIQKQDEEIVKVHAGRAWLVLPGECIRIHLGDTVGFDDDMARNLWTDLLFRVDREVSGE
jgi:hypothetical protein